MYTNIDGVLSSKLELGDYLKEMEPKIVCLAETKLSEGINLDLGNNYSIWRRDRVGKGGGGVMIITKKEVMVNKVEFGEGRAELISARVELNKKEVTIVVVYVPPKTNSWTKKDYEEIIEDTIRSLAKVIKDKRRVILLGDFNCKEVDWENYDSGRGDEAWGTRFLNQMMENMMVQRVKENTRLRGDDEPARLDLIFTKDIEICDDIIYKCPLGKSDHMIMEMEIEEDNMEVDVLYKGNRLNYRRADVEKLKEYFGNINWEEMVKLRGVQEKYNIFMEVYREGVRRYVPKYRPKEVGQNDWFNARCTKAKEKRDEAWKRWKRNRNLRNKENFKIARNEYVKVRKEEERQYEKDIVEKCKDQPKLFYKFINKKMKKRVTIELLKGEHGIIDDPKNMAELLNNKFQQVFTKESRFEKPLIKRDVRQMKVIRVTETEILELIKELDDEKAMGPDEVSGKILKECKEELVRPIHDIIKCSIESGEVPAEWKKAEVIPIYKNGNKEEPLNYRPVSLTSIVCKICESVIKKYWLKFLEDHKLISNSQFGFRKGRSCVTNLLSFYSRVTERVQERDGWVDCVYLDLKKAFDKVPHERLLWKLENMGGLSGNILKWMENYLRGREMRTIVKDIKSEWRVVESGVPQGSVLAPILFLIFINDMTEGLNSYINLFADDAKLCRVIRNEEDCETLQEDLNKIWKWSKKWEMEFNVAKSHVLEMGRSENRPVGVYRMGDEVELKKVTNEKDLGVIMQGDSQPESHINKIFRETYNLIRNIGLAFHYMDGEIMKKLISTIIRPRLEYAGVVWSPHKKKHIKKLERLQRIATKMVPGLGEKSYEERLMALGLTTLEQRRERGDLIQIYKLMNGMDQVDNENLILREENTGRSMRSHSKKLRKGRCLRDVKKYSFPQRCVEAWNGLSEEVVSAVNVHSFKEKLDKCRYGDGATRA